MRLPLPGPMDLVDAVREVAAAATALGRAATSAIALVPRMVTTLDQVDGLLARADVALLRLEQAAVDADLLLGTATPLVARLGAVLDDAEGVVQRVDDVLDRADTSIGRVDGVVTGAQASIGRADGVVDGARRSITRVDGVVDGAERSITRVDGVIDGAERSITRVDGVVARAETAVARVFDVLAGATGLVDNADDLLQQATPALRALLPLLQRMADTLDEREVEAAVLLLDRLPDLLQAVDRDLLPLAGALRDVGPELHELLGLVEDLHTMVQGLPGMRILRRRGGRDE